VGGWGTPADGVAVGSVGAAARGPYGSVAEAEVGSSSVPLVCRNGLTAQQLLQELGGQHDEGGQTVEGYYEPMMCSADGGSRIAVRVGVCCPSLYFRVVLSRQSGCP